MPRERKLILPPTLKQEDTEMQIKVDLKDVYPLEQGPLELDIAKIQYSNMAHIICQPRDIFIDFLELPGYRKDNITVVPTTRIYLTHVAAQKLAQAIIRILNKVHEKGEMETFEKEE